MKKWKKSAVIFGLVNLGVMVAIIFYWKSFFSQPGLYFVEERLFFAFYLSHGTVAWLILQSCWLGVWSFRLFKLHQKSFWGFFIWLYTGFFSIYALWSLAKFYYSYGFQSSWVRFFNSAELAQNITIWLGILVSPLLFLLVFLMFKGKKLNPTSSLKKYWNIGVLIAIAGFFLWGMALSHRNVYLETQNVLMTGILKDYPLLAIYNPVAALVAIVMSMFENPFYIGETAKNFNMMFSLSQIWPGFFYDVFYIKMSVMTLVTFLSIGFSGLVALAGKNKE